MMISLIDDFSQISMLEPPDEIIEIYKNVPEINEIDNRGFPICRPLFSHSGLPGNLGFKDVWVDDFDFKLPFVYATYVHHNQRLWTEHINLIPEGDYLARHNGISKKFNEMYPHHLLPVGAYNDELGIGKTYKSIVKHYEYK